MRVERNGVKALHGADGVVGKAQQLVEQSGFIIALLKLFPLDLMEKKRSSFFILSGLLLIVQLLKCLFNYLSCERWQLISFSRYLKHFPYLGLSLIQPPSYRYDIPVCLI